MNYVERKSTTLKHKPMSKKAFGITVERTSLAG
jgi:hypothetical protein